ncbi:MAG: molecular chaperone TorD family protein [Desulfopila sp.]|jgi:TorA maturation chaperone TorD|nr:molecular chaperone TorD family protein [Desulfopila sp.]
MKDMEEKEIKKVRLRLLDLVKSFYIEEPDATRISRWRGTFNALARERVNPLFDKSVMEIHQFLEKRNLKDMQEEYYTLFVDPFNEEQINMSASFHLDGRAYGQTLVELRSFLSETGLVKKTDVTEEEDSLVVLLDILIGLIDSEKDMDAGKAERLQGELLECYLVTFAQRFKEACEGNDTADFYKACARFFCGYLELEKGLTGTQVHS